MKQCETFGCKEHGIQMCQIAPGTNVWLCQRCLREMKRDDHQ